MPGSHEMMWPRLVASKILKKRLGSNNFIADILTDSVRLLEISGLDHKPALASNSIFLQPQTTTHTYKVFVSTWNMGGIVPDDDLDMEDLLDTRNTTCDIYVLGFQEVVPLRASNVLGSEDNTVPLKWNSLIRDALNQTSGKVKDNKKPVKSGISQDFQCIIGKKMVGILILVWVRSDLRPYIRHPSVSCVGCGIMGCLGNKGSVSIRFVLHETSFCFVCSHLASGGRERDEKQRNSNITEIFSRTSFPGGPSHDLPKKILDHDRVVLLGDLNYRISLPEETTRLLVDRREWTTLLENDQLRMELMHGKQFHGWHEGTIKFAPTYKYIPNSDFYYGCLQDRQEDKKRSPAWCDRIICHGDGLKKDTYTRGESKMSDHRPVKAIFAAEVKVLPNSKSFRSFFLTDKLEDVTSQIEISAMDNSWTST